MTASNTRTDFRSFSFPKETPAQYTMRAKGIATRSMDPAGDLALMVMLGMGGKPNAIEANRFHAMRRAITCREVMPIDAQVALIAALKRRVAQ